MSPDLADILLEAIQNGGSLDIESVPQPDLEEAYAVQSAVFARLGVPSKGHKLSLRSDGVLSAPLLSVSEDASFPYRPGVKLEVEIALILGSDIPVRSRPYTRDEIRDAVAAAHMGIEFVHSRYTGGPQGRTTLLVADFMSNAGYRVGPELERDVLNEGRTADDLHVIAGDHILFDAPGAHPDGDPLSALVAYASMADRPENALRRGAIITTGSLCGGLPVPHATPVAISLGRTTWNMEIDA